MQHYEFDVLTYTPFVVTLNIVEGLETVGHFDLTIDDATALESYLREALGSTVSHVAGSTREIDGRLFLTDCDLTIDPTATGFVWLEAGVVLFGQRREDGVYQILDEWRAHD